MYTHTALACLKRWQIDRPARAATSRKIFFFFFWWFFSFVINKTKYLEQNVNFFCLFFVFFFLLYSIIFGHAMKVENCCLFIFKMFCIHWEFSIIIRRIRRYRQRRWREEANSCRVEPAAAVTGCRTGATSTDAMTWCRTAAEERRVDARSWCWAASVVAFCGDKRYTKSWAESEHRPLMSTWAAPEKILLLLP